MKTTVIQASNGITMRHTMIHRTARAWMNISNKNAFPKKRSVAREYHDQEQPCIYYSRISIAIIRIYICKISYLGNSDLIFSFPSTFKVLLWPPRLIDPPTPPTLRQMEHKQS